MQRVIDSLNEMSFDLPENWQVSEDVYSLPNGQGMINKENYVSHQGEVISLFEIHRDPDEFFKYYDQLLENYNQITQKYALIKKTKIKAGDFIFPAYMIKGFDGQTIFTLQVFCNCGDCLGCFMLTLPNFNGSFKELFATSHICKELVKILRTIE